VHGIGCLPHAQQSAGRPTRMKRDVQAPASFRAPPTGKGYFFLVPRKCANTTGMAALDLALRDPRR
jgi:hypothetical protein